MIGFEVAAIIGPCPSNPCVHSANTLSGEKVAWLPRAVYPGYRWQLSMMTRCLLLKMTSWLNLLRDELVTDTYGFAANRSVAAPPAFRARSGKSTQKKAQRHPTPPDPKGTTSATLLGTSALLVVTMFASRNKCIASRNNVLTLAPSVACERLRTVAT